MRARCAQAFTATAMALATEDDGNSSLKRYPLISVATCWPTGPPPFVPRSQDFCNRLPNTHGLTPPKNTSLFLTFQVARPNRSDVARPLAVCDIIFQISVEGSFHVEIPLFKFRGSLYSGL